MATENFRSWNQCSQCTDLTFGPVGACCSGSGTCSDGILEAACLADPDATWFSCELCSDVQAQCEPIGACCLCDGTCLEFITEAECQANSMFVIYRPAAACSVAACVTVGACCFEASCQDGLTEDQCLSNPNAVFYVVCEICSAIDCGGGACCLPDGTCMQLLPPECAAQDGLYQGEGTICPAPGGPRVSVTDKGSLLIYSKVDIRWDAAGFVTRDTFLSLTNDFPEDVTVQMYFINGDPPLDAGGIERAHPGWNWVDNRITLTGDQPTFWSALTGQPAAGGLSPFTALDPGFPPGRSDGLGGRMLRGYVIAWAVSPFGAEIRWNHLSGNGVIVDYALGAAWEYLPWSFAVVANVANGGLTGGPTQIDLSGLEFAHAYDLLLVNFQAVRHVLGPGAAQHLRAAESLPAREPPDGPRQDADRRPGQPAL
ncbi:MAG: hypothetical protein GY715_13195 [Planctomycetes bacterium]|nr:hypothetical protein [Planctomycetota bacterium]